MSTRFLLLILIRSQSDGSYTPTETNAENNTEVTMDDNDLGLSQVSVRNIYETHS